MRSLHDPKNKTQKVFRGWDYGEIIEWMEVDYKDSKFKMIKYRLREFFKTIKKAFKDLFSNRFIDREQRENEETKKVLDYLMDKLYEDTYKSTKLDPKYKEKVQGLRTYVEELSKYKNSYIQPLWEGLSKIKDDGEFIRYVKHFFESLWD